MSKDKTSGIDLTGICLVTDNVPRLADFYSQILGVRAEGGDEHAELKAGGAGVAIFSAKGMERMAPGSTPCAGSGSAVLMFRVSDIAEEYRRLQVLGVEFVKPLQTHPWGATSFWFRDPDGNIVDFFCDTPG